LIQSSNRKNKIYTLALNQFADYTKDDMRARKGRLISTGNS